MANFTISVGTLTSAPVTVDAAKAISLIDTYLEMQGVAVATNQQKMDALAIAISNHIRESVYNYTRRKLARQAEQNTPAATWE